MGSAAGRDPGASNLGPLNGVASGTSESLAEHAKQTYKGNGPSIRIESAEGITTYPGLNGDTESAVARKFINNRLAKINSAAPQVAKGAPAKRPK